MKVLDFEDYPMEPLDARPLHSPLSGCQGGEWWFACEFPERPLDAYTLHDWRCHACLLHASACLAKLGDREGLWQYHLDGDMIVVKLSWLIERAIYWQERT